jgi:hypothetical protein
MASKKKTSPAPTGNGEPVLAPAEKEPKPRRMTKAQRERRIRALQEQVARLKAMAEEIQGPQEWHKLIGSHADDPETFEEAMRLGREWRESFRAKPRGLSGTAVVAPEGGERM